MTGYVTDIAQKAHENGHFREVLFTTPQLQLVVMTLQPGEEIGLERHESTTQFVRIEGGVGQVLLNGEAHALRDGTAVVVPAGVEHNFVNTSEAEPLRLYTLYAPPAHRDGTVHHTKAEAEEDEGPRQVGTEKATARSGVS